MLTFEQALTIYGIERLMEADVVLTGLQSESVVNGWVQTGFQLQRENVSVVNDKVAKKIIKDARKKAGKDDDKEKVDKTEETLADYWLLENPSKALFVIVAQPGSWEVQFKGRLGPDGEPVPRETPSWYHWEIKEDGTLVVAINLYDGRLGQILATTFEYSVKYSMPDGTTTIE